MALVLACGGTQQLAVTLEETMTRENGVSGNVDRNLFNGSLADLKAFAGGGYAAEFVAQSFPYAADGPSVLHAREELTATIELRNVGTKPWNESTKLATTEPRDRESVFAGPEWPASNRLAAVEGEVLPGETYVFTFVLHAPAESGTHAEYFGMVQDGEAWFSDPGHGGPPDNQLQGVFEVVAGGGSGGGAGAGGSGGHDAAETRDDTRSGASDADGCTVHAGSRGGTCAGLLLLVMALEHQSVRNP